MLSVDELCAAVVVWGKRRSDVIAIALLGSYATGTFRDDSDVDLVVVVESTALYCRDDTWLGEFGQLDHLSDEEYGLVQARRAYYRHGLEVEWVLADRRWLEIPPEPGTAAVVAAGMRILYDRTGRLAALQRAVRGDP